MTTTNSLTKRISSFSLEPFRDISKVAIAILVLSTIFNTLFFNQGNDINHTVISSYAYLNGHFTDFYDYNSTVVVRNDYLPFIYVIFAIWMSPFALAGKLPNLEASQALFLSRWELIWAKTLILIVFVIAFYLLWKISQMVFSKSRSRQQIVVWAFAFSPIAAYALTAFTQYDIVGIAFSLAGIYAYLRNKTMWFIFFFAVAISLKFFALIVFIPLVLLKYKQIWKILLFGIAGVSFTLLEILMYLPNQAFAENFLVLARRKTGESTTTDFSIFILILALIGCIYIWRMKISESNKGLAIALSSATAFGLFFEAASWHPQWLILIVPYFALVTGFLKNIIVFLSFEILGFIAFIWITVNRFPLNADGTMLEKGPLHNLLPLHHSIMAEYYSANLMWLALIIFGIYLVSPLLFWIIEGRNNISISEVVLPQWVWIVRASAFPVIFTIPALIAIF